MLHLLDTDTVSFLLRRKFPSIRENLERLHPDDICISVITRAELLYGLQKLPPDAKIHLGVRRFLQIVRTLPWDADAAGYYAQIRHQLTRLGLQIGELDMMIAAHALSAGAVLVTNNTRHYDRLSAPLILQNWTNPK